MKSSYRSLFRTKKSKHHKSGIIKEGPRKKHKPKETVQIEMDRRKTILCQSTNNLNKDITKELMRQKTQDPLNKSQVLFVPSQEKTGNSLIGDSYDLKRNIAQASNRIMNFVVKNPIPSTGNNLNLSSISKHERTPSFINKLPVDLKNCLLKDMDSKSSDKSHSNFLNIGENHFSHQDESESSQSNHDEDTESESSVSQKESDKSSEKNNDQVS